MITLRANKQHEMNKIEITMIIIFGFIGGAAMSLMAALSNETIHSAHQPITFGYAPIITLVILVPIYEELLKRGAVQIISVQFPKFYFNLIVVFSVAYGFQVFEAILYSEFERDWYERLVLPLHVLFTLASCKFGLRFGIALHALWNSQAFIIQSYIIQMSFIILSYFLLILLLYILDLKLKSETIKSQHNL